MDQDNTRPQWEAIEDSASFIPATPQHARKVFGGQVTPTFANLDEGPIVHTPRSPLQVLSEIYTTPQLPRMPRPFFSEGSWQVRMRAGQEPCSSASERSVAHAAASESPFITAPQGCVFNKPTFSRPSHRPQAFYGLDEHSGTVFDDSDAHTHLSVCQPLFAE